MKIDKDARYSNDHEWVRKEGDLYAYGITDHAQDQLSDIVYVEPPQVGETYQKGDTVGVVESVKAASDLYLPMDGEIFEINETLVDTPEILNSDPYGGGWILKFRASDEAQFSQLMSPEEYEVYIKE